MPCQPLEEFRPQVHVAPDAAYARKETDHAPLCRSDTPGLLVRDSAAAAVHRCSAIPCLDRLRTRTDCSAL
jgi:hypothetical protein